MALPAGITGDAFPKGSATYRHWLSRTWNPKGRVALVVGINPNKATHDEEDAYTETLRDLLRNLDGENKCGGFVLVNVCDVRHNDPKTLKSLTIPLVSKRNTTTIKAQLAACDFVVASWGTSDYGLKVKAARATVEALVRASVKRKICFSARGAPIHIGIQNLNLGQLSKTPTDWK